MKKNELLQLTETDKEAIILGDSNYINGKGAVLYNREEYKDAMEYYHIAAAMDNVQAISNLGYCYLYGRDINQNTSLALAYFKIAALKGSDYAAYKLGNIYEVDDWNIKDPEKAVYYYRMALSYILGEDNETDAILEHDELQRNPSLCLAVGRALTPNGIMGTDLRRSYQFLLHAKRGYEIALENGDEFYQDSLAEVEQLLELKCFDEIRDEYDKIFNYVYYGVGDVEDDE